MSEYGVQVKDQGEWYTITKDKKGFCLGWMYGNRERSPRSAYRVIRISDGKVVGEITSSPINGPREDERWWKLTRHQCAKCNSRLLVCVAGNGMTAGGNPYWSCVTCEWQWTSLGPPRAEDYPE